MANLDVQYDPAQIIPYGRPVMPISAELKDNLSKPRNESEEPEVVSNNYWETLSIPAVVEAKEVRKPKEVQFTQVASSSPSTKKECRKVLEEIG